MKTKIERYTEKFIETNFDKKDKKKSKSLKFEWFVNSMHCWEYSSQSFNRKSKIGKEISLGQAEGGDAFFLLIGNTIYSLNDSIDDIKEAIQNNKNKIEFHLIQTKKSNNANLGDFKNFTEIPIKVIKKEGISQGQKELNDLASFMDTIIQGNPELEASFVLTFYTEKDENNVEKLRSDWKEEISYIENRYAEYGVATIKIEGSKKINQLYEKFISNDYKIIISKDDCKYQDNYLIGFLNAKALLDGIAPLINNKRTLYPDVFKNNIRLYLGSTEVNQKIEKTLIEEPKKFHLYNNGLTITTKDIKAATENFIISPVNIVNGCQTANSIYNVFKDDSSNIEDVKIPVKIIIANDEEYEKITIRTNSQNGISEKDLVSINTIQKDLEEFLSKNRFQGKSFFYKRQNSIQEGVNLENIDYLVTINDILRAFFSSVLYIPHKVLGYFDKTTNNLIDVIFEDRFIKLYQITVSLYKVLDDYIEAEYSDFRKLRYHLLYLLYKFINKDNNIDTLEKYFIKDKNKKNFEELKGETLAQQNELIDKVYSSLHIATKDSSKLKKIIDYLIDVIKKEYPILVNIDTREKEKILYKTVDKNQRGEQLFENFEQKFTKNINDFINGTN